MTDALQVDVTVQSDGWNDLVPQVETVAVRASRAALAAAFPDIPLLPAEVSVVLTGDAEIADLNQSYRDKKGATNVLAFPVLEDAEQLVVLDGGMAEGPPLLLGDIVIAAGVVAREASQQDKSVHDHFCHMVVHGTLHLVGYDHLTDDEAREMEQLETEVLAGLSIANPYDAS